MFQVYLIDIKWFFSFIEVFLVPPVFNDSLVQVKLPALINSTLKLHCSAYGFPKPVVNWTFNTNFIPKNKRNEEFVIESVQVKERFLVTYNIFIYLD
jgi:hypothetical protein